MTKRREKRKMSTQQSLRIKGRAGVDGRAGRPLVDVSRAENEAINVAVSAARTIPKGTVLGECIRGNGRGGKEERKRREKGKEPERVHQGQDSLEGSQEQEGGAEGGDRWRGGRGRPTTAT